MHGTWLSLLPPIVVLFVGTATRQVLLSLGCGIFSAALIASDFSALGTIKLMFNSFWSNIQLESLLTRETFWNNGNFFICIFLCILGIIVTLISHSGGAYAYGNAVRKKIYDKKTVETSSLMLSTFLFIDDYFSSLTVGSVMHPLTDHFRIPRAKLAFLVDSMAAPLAVLAPISSWVAAIIGFLSENGVSPFNTYGTLILAEPLSIYTRMMPFVFYSFIIIPSAWLIVRKNISFGLMNKHEQIAQESGNLFAGKEPISRKVRTVHERNIENNSILDFAVPILILFISVIGGMLYSGNYVLFGGKHSFVEAFQTSRSAIGLFLGGTFALIFCILFLLARRKIYLNEVPKECWGGIKLMMPAIIILLLSWTLGDLLRENLRTGEYLANVLVGSVNLKFFPLMFFLSAAATSFALGTSWGTMAIMFPLAIPMVISFLNLSTPTTIDHVSLLFPVLGAIVSGAVSGDHISPISDTTIMSSTSCGSYHVDHVQTQMTYAIPVLISTAVAYLVAGFLVGYPFYVSILLPFLIGLFLAFSILIIMSNRRKNK